MDKAIINGIVVSAYEISLDYEKEKFVRKCSKNKEIFCTDKDCINPILRYCHGDKKVAYFAHLMNTDCDYDKFDKNDTMLFKELRIKLLVHLTSLGYKVELEQKLLKHHYSPIVCTKDKQQFVIEMGDSKTTVGTVEKLLQEYSLKQIPVKWLVVGEEILSIKEDNISFLKRFLLNESKNNDFILINENEIIQYRLDVYNIKGYQEIYSEKSILEKLVVIDGELTIEGFNSKYEEWKSRKKKVIELEQEIRKESKKLMERQEIKQNGVDEFETHQQKKLSFEENHSNNSNLIYSYGTKTYTCTECGKKAGESEFYMTKEDIGVCWECHYGSERYEEIKRLKNMD